MKLMFVVSAAVTAFSAAAAYLVTQLAARFPY